MENNLPKFIRELQAEGLPLFRTRDYTGRVDYRFHIRDWNKKTERYEDTGFTLMRGCKSSLRRKWSAKYAFSMDKAERYISRISKHVHGNQLFLKLNIPINEQNKRWLIGEWFGVFIFNIIAAREQLHSNSIACGDRHFTPDRLWAEFGDVNGRRKNHALYYKVIPFPDGRVLLWKDEEGGRERFETMEKLRHQLFKIESDDHEWNVLDFRRQR